MIEFINKTTGGKMYVDDSRVEEYKAAGNKLASAPLTPEAPKTVKESEKTAVVSPKNRKKKS